MDPPLINDSTFSAANPSSYTLSEIWPFSSSGLGLRMPNFGGQDGNFSPFQDSSSQNHNHNHSSLLRDASADESTFTDLSTAAVATRNHRKRKGSSVAAAASEDDSSRMVSTSSANDLNDSDIKRIKLGGSVNENDASKTEVEASSVAGDKSAQQSSKSCEPPKQDYIHVRARRGQATDSHSLAERARREKISERMKILQDLVPGCNKVIGKALVLDEIINYIQSLQRQVEFLSMKLEAVNSRLNVNPTIDGFSSKDVATQPFDIAGMIIGSPASRGYAQGSQLGWLHMQIGSDFGRTT
ncbi:hypothetical protein PIB30_039405 [Stylosanthes scabra]|uniref:BHLH domain-containing protein n=1 Tax=Stylosanthes scabra TaxID=79078 RepID=A0ABU6QFS9_9FABA|nr:hypothetical protein [Stylosanthes scabra]